MRWLAMNFNGMDRFEARSKAVEKLTELGLLVREEEYQNNVGYSERGGVPIEPRLSEQWFLKYPTRHRISAGGFGRSDPVSAGALDQDL